MALTYCVAWHGSSDMMWLQCSSSVGGQVLILPCLEKRTARKVSVFSNHILVHDRPQNKQYDAADFPTADAVLQDM